MKKSTLRQIIREEIRTLIIDIKKGKDYSIQDIYNFVKDGERVMVSTTGGVSAKSYNTLFGKPGSPEKSSVTGFEKDFLSKSEYKNKKFTASKAGSDWLFTLKGSKGNTSARDFYDKLDTRVGGGTYKGD